MENNEGKRFDLGERTFEFAQSIRAFCKSIKLNVINIDDVKQVIRSSGSVGANYIEAQEAFSKKDFYHRIKICRKEAKESNYWLELIVLEDSETESTKNQKNKLAEEAIELTKIFGAIINKNKDE